MIEELTVTTERVDDIPILLSQAKKMGIPELLDGHFPAHGNWEGSSLGWTMAVWLAHILSEGDHRLNQVQSWAAKRLHTLQMGTGQPVRALEWSDDRLGLGLDALSDSENWRAFERALNRRTVRVYNLKQSRVRVDSTTASGYWTVTEDGLFQFGHSKDHRPDLPQLKVMLSTLDPLGMPLATQVVSGELADDPLYIPAIQQVSESLGEHGLLYIGDCKMAAIGTRAFIQAQNDYYLCPLSEKQLPQETLGSYLTPVWQKEQDLTAVTRITLDGKTETLAEGYEQSLVLTQEFAGQTVAWTERRLVIRSQQQAQAAEAGLQTRLRQAHAELAQLNESKQGKARIADMDSMQAAASAVLKHRRVEGLFKLTISEQLQERPVRAYGGRPARIEIERQVTLQVAVDAQAVQDTSRWFGWRVYVTNHPAATLSLEQALLAYREEYLVEHGFGRLKGKPLSLTPMYLQSDTRATGLIHLLSLGLRLLTLLEHQVRTGLAERQDKLAGLYAGNPKRTTSRPTAEAVLTAFKGIDLAVVTIADQLRRHVTPLSALHKKILSLLDFPVAIYSQLVGEFPGPAG
jgi:transposase